ncbi:hypothetical protein QR680_008762 [Steinernema hermaphroditum]|uniref:Sidoreflexin n=1 Tax=Steinernema hermaphroditum TaxID=289476 RepID=A0AA39IJS2_9BILA|nr:hypothetical protein QR680_008762 [Steinernema hermaphroditum]
MQTMRMCIALSRHRSTRIRSSWIASSSITLEAKIISIREELSETLIFSDLYLPIVISYICVGLAISTIAFDIGSAYVRRLFFVGKRITNIANINIWFGSRSLKVKDLIMALGQNIGLEPTFIGHIDLEKLVTIAIKVKEGKMAAVPQYYYMDGIWPPELVPLFMKEGYVPIFVDSDELDANGDVKKKESLISFDERNGKIEGSLYGNLSTENEIRPIDEVDDSDNSTNGRPFLMSSELVISLVTRPDVTKPRWDQSTFEGRLSHFYSTVNPLNLFACSQKLAESQKVITDYKKGMVSPSLTVEQLWRHKQIYDSAFHPETGDKMFLLGRMSAQVPCNMMLTGSMLTFYRRTASVVFLHWLNQSFNAVVNYTNRSGENPITKAELFRAYCCATGSAVGVALGLNSVVAKLHPLIGRLVPFVAVAAANAVNIPMMRYKEFTNGIRLEDEHGNFVARSTSVAKYAIPEVVVSRIGMAVPVMVLIPMIMNQVDKTQWYKRRPWVAAPLQVFLVGCGLLVSTPFCCALFPQKKSVEVAKLDPEARAQIEAVQNPPKVVYYNKGL